MSNEIYRQSQISLYDSANKSELFQVKSLESKATLTSSKPIEFHNEKLTIKNYNPEGEVIDEVKDVVAEFRKNQSDIANESAERQAAVAQATEQMEAAVASEAVLREEGINNTRDYADSQVELEAAARADAINGLDIQIANETVERTTAITDLGVVTTNNINAAKADLEAKVDAEKQRIDLILQGADVSLDSFKEIVDYSNNINTERLEQISAVANNLASHNAEFEKLKQIIIALAPDSASHFSPV